ncbi:HAD family hydrolase [Bacillus sp. SA1-12]|uniref:HAD family hydrolase n=1 Tax=Bacillus sp. SA1-12 TaxID=1455638 RepID=UPI000625FFC3|nr:HAD family hydrolase [Bacillus sp. SA1-12]KKI92368.1 HAD family hydrolase [Bacillus sp. SA1-12]
MIKAVVFDFDGLIIDTEFALYEAFRKMLKLHASEFPIADYASYIGTDSKALYDFILEKTNGTMTLEEVIETSSLLHKDNLKNPVARDGVEDYLKEAKSLGLKIGLASSSDRKWVTFFLKELNLLEYFDIIQTKDDVEKVKPDPALYQNVIHYFKIDPSEAIAFEDSANGSMAAIAAGLNCVIVPNKITENLLFENIHLKLTSMKDKEFSDVVKVIESLYVS